MQKDFDHAVAVLVQVFFIAADLAVALFKKVLLAVFQHARGHLVGLLQVVDLHHQNVLVIAAVENGNAAAGRQNFVHPPQKVVVQFLAGGLLEAGYLYTLGVQAAHHMLYGAVLPSGIQRLQNDHKALAPIGVKGVLQGGHLFQVFGSFGQDIFFLYMVILAVAGQLAQRAWVGTIKQIAVSLHPGCLLSAKGQNYTLSVYPFWPPCATARCKKGIADARPAMPFS